MSPIHQALQWITLAMSLFASSTLSYCRPYLVQQLKYPLDF
jgi:hypothetical protein